VIPTVESATRVEPAVEEEQRRRQQQQQEEEDLMVEQYELQEMQRRVQRPVRGRRGAIDMSWMDGCAREEEAMGTVDDMAITVCPRIEEAAGVQPRGAFGRRLSI